SALTVLLLISSTQWIRARPPLDRVLGSMVIDKLEADHQRVSSAKYFAALRRRSRSSRSFAFSFSNWRIRSESFAAWALSCTALMRARFPVPYFLTQE